jgi:hypothetical protein
MTTPENSVITDIAIFDRRERQWQTPWTIRPDRFAYSKILPRVIDQRPIITLRFLNGLAHKKVRNPNDDQKKSATKNLRTIEFAVTTRQKADRAHG